MDTTPIDVRSRAKAAALGKPQVLYAGADFSLLLLRKNSKLM